jgi:hypothetical protein
MPGIKLGRDLNASSTPDLPNERKLGARSGMPARGPASLANEGIGSTEKDRKIAGTARDFLANIDKQKPNPVLVAAALVAAMILPVALIFAPKTGALDFNPHDVAQEYASYLKKAGGGPPPEKVLPVLEDLRRLEDSGRKSEARLLWASLFLSTGNNPANPVRDLASRHLSALK